MKGMLRRISAMLLAVVLVLGTGVTVLAAEATATSTGTLEVAGNGDTTVTTSATVTISNIPEDATVSFSTYQVLYATYDSEHNSLVYCLTDWAKAALVNPDDNTRETYQYATEEEAITALVQITAIATGSATTATSTTEQSELINYLASYVKDNSTAAYGAAWADGTVSSGYYSANASLPIGAYLVLPGCATMSFLNMLVSVDASATTGTASDAWQLKVHDAVLKGKEITLTKTVTDDSTRTSTSYVSDGDTAQAQVGDMLYYSLKVDVPQFAANSDDNKKIDIKFIVTDLPANLWIDSSSVVVTAYTSSTDTTGTILTAYSSDPTSAAYSTYNYKVSLNEGDTSSTYGMLTVDFSEKYLSTFYTATGSDVGTYPYQYIIITYKAELLSTAVVTTGNSNTATLTYGNYTDNTGTATDNATVYTYQLELEKKGKDGDNTVLSNASFKIYTLDGTTKTYLTFIKDSSGNYVIADSADKADSSVTKYEQITTGSDGKVTLIGLDGSLDGSVTYYIEESVAPSGYSLNTNYLEFAITGATDTDSTSTTYGDLTGKIASVSASEYQSGNATAIETYPDTDNTNKGSWTIDVATSNTASLSLTLTDTKLPSLPATGSVGIIIFTIAGVALMIAAVFILYSGKSREKSGGEKA